MNKNTVTQELSTVLKLGPEFSGRTGHYYDFLKQFFIPLCLCLLYE